MILRDTRNDVITPACIICMYACCKRIYLCTCFYMHFCLYTCMYVSKNVCLYVCMYVCMYVCIKCMRVKWLILFVYLMNLSDTCNDVITHHCLLYTDVRSHHCLLYTYVRMLHKYVFLYVRVYVCMYILCIWVCLYCVYTCVCRYVCMYEWMSVKLRTSCISSISVWSDALHSYLRHHLPVDWSTNLYIYIYNM